MKLKLSVITGVFANLARQIDSAPYQRLALSANKDKMKALSEKGQIIESASDAKLQGEFSLRNVAHKLFVPVLKTIPDSHTHSQTCQCNV